MSSGQGFEQMTREELVAQLESVLAARRGDDEKHSYEVAVEPLLHELRVHQVELEMQNRDLREAQSALEESRNRYAELYNFAPVAYYTFDTKGCILEVNLTGATMVGRDRAQLIGMPFAPFAGKPDGGVFWQHLRRCASERGPMVSELSITSARGNQLPVQAISVPVLDSVGSVVAFRTVFSDISLRKQAESEEKRAREGEQRLRAQLEVVDRVSMVVAHSLAIQTDIDLSPVLQTVVDEARHLVESQYAALGLGQKIENSFSEWVFSGMGEPSPGTFTNRFPKMAVLLREVLRTGRAIRIEDLQAHPNFTGYPTQPLPITSLLAVPVGFGGQIMGILILSNKNGATPFTEEDQRSAEMLSERIGFILEIVRLSRLRAREQGRLVLLAETGETLPHSLDPATTLNAVAHVSVPALGDYCAVYLVEEDELKLRGFAHKDEINNEMLGSLQRVSTAISNLPDNVYVELLRTKKAILIPDLSAMLAGAVEGNPELANDLAALGPRSAMMVPCAARGRLLGAMAFVYGDSGRVYDASDLPFAEEIAYRAGLAVDNGRLYAEAKAAIQSRENLLAVVSHDLRNPLSAITLAVGALLSTAAAGAPSTSPAGGPVGEGARSSKLINLISRSATGMSRLIEELLTATTIESGRFVVRRNPETVERLLDEVEQMLSPIVESRSLRFTRRHHGPLPEILCDRDQLLRVFANLVGNATKVTPAGGEICVTAEQTDQWVSFSVSDSGCGIPEAQLPHLFERFWKGEASGRNGIGLGLFIARGIVEAHGGQIRVESTVGVGTTFFFTMPIPWSIPEEAHTYLDAGTLPR